MRRVVVTGLGIKSSIGNTPAEVVESLREARSGVEFCPEYEELGFRSHVYAPVRVDVDALIDRKQRRFMGDAAAYAYLAMRDAIADAISALDDVATQTTFPYMGVTPTTYINNIGHIDSPGCFRCHGKLVAYGGPDAGQPISKDCDLCHYFTLNEQQ